MSEPEDATTLGLTSENPGKVLEFSGNTWAGANLISLDVLHPSKHLRSFVQTLAKISPQKSGECRLCLSETQAGEECGFRLLSSHRETLHQATWPGPREPRPPATRASTPAAQALGAVRLFTMGGPLMALPTVKRLIQGEE